MKSALIFGDTHVPYQSPKALKVINKIALDLQPDSVIHIGDLVDCWSISDFDKDPLRRDTLQDNIDEAAALLGSIRRALPKAACYLLEGNHEDRLRRTIWRMNEKQRELARLRDFQTSMTWPSLLKLGTDWTFVPSAGQAKFRILPKLVTKHGTVVRKWSGQSAKAEWERYGKSGLSGHTHRLGSFFTNDFNGAHIWTETGCTCDINPQYVEDPNWQQGCVVVSYVGDRFAVEPIYIQNGHAVWRGKDYAA